MESLYILSDKQYALVASLLQEEKDPRGRKPKISDRQALEGILYVLHKGCSWRELPENFGRWMAVFMRYQRWVERGVLWKTLMRLQKAGALKVCILTLEHTSAQVISEKKEGVSCCFKSGYLV